MKIAVLAVQGAFVEHENMLHRLGIETVELRKYEDLEAGFDGLILPGGESSVQGKLLKDMGMEKVLTDKIRAGLPVLATCAGMILLAKDLENDTRRYFQTMPIEVRRNAYGRQLGSFRTEENFQGIGKVPMTFIRAPYVVRAEKEVTVLAKVNGNITAVRYQNQLALAFHPELDGDFRIHQYFVEMVQQEMQFREKKIFSA